MTEIRALVFDFGAVVAFFSHARVCEQVAALSRGSVEADQVRRWIFESGRHIELETGAMDPERFLVELQSDLVPNASIEELRRAYSNIFEPNPVVCDIIQRLKPGLPIYLGSNTDPLHWAQIAKQFAGPLSRFTGMIRSFEVGARKPAVEFFQAVVAETGVTPEECLFIDDLAANVEAAVSIGMHAIVYSQDFDLEGAMRDWGIEVLLGSVEDA